MPAVLPRPDASLPRSPRAEVSATAVTPAVLREPEAAPRATARSSADGGAGATGTRSSSAADAAVRVACVVSP